MLKFVPVNKDNFVTFRLIHYHSSLPETKIAVPTVEHIDTAKSSNAYEDNAALGTEQEKSMPLGQAFRYYHKAAIWSVLICELTIPCGFGPLPR